MYLSLFCQSVTEFYLNFFFKHFKSIPNTLVVHSSNTVEFECFFLMYSKTYLKDYFKCLFQIYILKSI